jgi:hypothetical protein
MPSPRNARIIALALIFSFLLGTASIARSQSPAQGNKAAKPAQSDAA